MVVLTRTSIAKLEEFYYWSGYKCWVPFPRELKQALLEAYGEEPSPHDWTEQDLNEGTRNIIQHYFQARGL